MGVRFGSKRVQSAQIRVAQACLVSGMVAVSDIARPAASTKVCVTSLNEYGAVTPLEIDMEMATTKAIDKCGTKPLALKPVYKANNALKRCNEGVHSTSVARVSVDNPESDAQLGMFWRLEEQVRKDIACRTNKDFRKVKKCLALCP